MKRKNGFTLVELLAVIAILAVIMLIAVVAVLPMVNKARKKSLYDEGLALIKAAEMAYKDESITFETPNGYRKPISGHNTCMTLEFLHQKGYYEKGSDDNYGGSVYIEYDNGKYNYYFNITNFNNVCFNGTKNGNADSCNKYVEKDGTSEKLYECDDYIRNLEVYCNEDYDDDCVKY